MTRPSHWLLAFVLIALGATAALRSAGMLLPRDVASVPLHAKRPEPVQIEERRPAPPSDATRAGATGRLLDRLGRGIAGAQVRHLGSGEQVRTDRDGRFELRTAPRRSQRLLLHSDRHEARIVTLHPDPTGSEAVFLLGDAEPWITRRSLVASEPTTPLAGEGFLRGPGGAIARGCVVVQETGAAVLTDEVGRFRVPLPAGSATLVAYDEDGRCAESGPITPSRRQGLVPLPELILDQPGAVVRGRVRDADGKPVGGAALVLQAGGVLRRAVTDEGGAFAIGGLPAGACTLDLLPHDGLLGQRVEAPAGADLELELRRAIPLQLRVVDRDRRAQPDLLVVARGASGVAQARTDAEGRAVLEGLPGDPGELRFEVRDGASFALRALHGFDAATRTLTLR